jgi:hypothetical protein
MLQFSILPNADEFTLQGMFMAESPTDDVYLFLFPTAVDDPDGHLAVRMPPESQRYYWSFDPEGIEYLPQDALDQLTLPHVNFEAFVYGQRWSQEVYDSIANVHRTKGSILPAKMSQLNLDIPSWMSTG